MVFGARLRVAPGGQFCRENLEAGAPDSASGGGNKGTCVVCRGWHGYSETPTGPEAAPQPPALLGRFTSHTQQPTWRPAPPSRHRSGCQRWCASRSRGGRALLCCHGGPGQLRARLCPGLAGGHGPSGLLAKPESPLCPQQARCGPHSAAGVYSHPVSVVTRGRLLSVPVAGSRGIPGAYSLLLSLPQGFSSPGGAPATATQAPAAHSVRTESRGQAGLPALRKRGHSVAGLLEPFLPQKSWPALGAPHTQASVLGQSSRAPTLCPLGTKPSGDTEAVLAGALWPRLG